MKLAFEIAETHLSIPVLLEVEDLINVEKPDERSIMTYVGNVFPNFYILYILSH